MKKQEVSNLRKMPDSISSRPNLQPVQLEVENQTTRQTSRAGILMETFERWTDENAPLHPFQAAVRILFACALYQTHDALKLQQLTGLPLPFISRTISILLGSSLWFGPEGLVLLMSDLEVAPNDEHRIDSLLGELGHQIFRDEDYSSLCQLWSIANPASYWL